MSLVSNLFIIFVAGAVLLYYLLPKKMRWWGLLLTSYIYYLAAGTKYFPFLLFSTIITYLCGLAIEHEVNQDKKKAKRYLIIGLILNFGMLGVIKYTNFILENINLAFHLPEETLNEYQESYKEAWEYFGELFEKEEVEYLNFYTEYYDLFSHDITKYTDYDGHMNGGSARNYSTILGYFLRK